MSTTLRTGDPDTTDGGQPIVTAVDHLVITGSAAQSLLALCTDMLGLPVAWPPDSLGGLPFITAGVRAGNVSLEIDWPAGGAPEDSSVRITGLVFQPVSAEAALAELDARGFGHSPPFAPRDAGYAERMASWYEQWPNPDPQLLARLPPDTPVFTAASIAGFLETGTLAVCEYPPVVLHSQIVVSEQLRAAGGGPLGLIGVDEVRVSVPDLAEGIARWQRLFDPLPAAAPGLWRLEHGPAIRLVEGDVAQIDGLVMRVHSLERARTFLVEHGLLLDEQDGRLVIDPAQVYSLRLTVVAGRG